MRRYAVMVRGYDPWFCDAETPAKARYQCYLAFIDALHPTMKFREFFDISKVRLA